MTDITKIRDAFNQLVPGIAEMHENYYRRTLAGLRERHGPTYGLGCRLDSYSRDYALVRTVATFLRFEHGRGSGKIADPRAVDEQHLIATCQQDAQAQVDMFVVKLERKLADLADVAMVEVKGMRFTIIGRLGERQVRVEQTITVSVSPKGKVFNQFPARIYVDGKFMSEAKYKQLPR